MRPASWSAAAMIAVLAALPASAAVLDFRIDDPGLDFYGAITVTGGFTYDAGTGAFSDIDLVAAGSGGYEGSYSLLAGDPVRTFLSATTLAVMRTGSGPDFTGATAVFLDFASALAQGGTVVVSSLSFVQCGTPDCFGWGGATFSEPFGTPGSVSVVVSGPPDGPAPIPLPAALPLLLGALGPLALLRRRGGAPAT